MKQDTVFDDNSLMPFGEYKGKALVNVPAERLLWYYDKGYLKDGLKKYVEENRDVLYSQTKNARR